MKFNRRGLLQRFLAALPCLSLPGTLLAGSTTPAVATTDLSRVPITPVQLLSRANHFAYVLLSLTRPEAREKFQKFKQRDPLLASLIRREMTRITYNRQHNHSPLDSRYWHVGEDRSESDA